MSFLMKGIILFFLFHISTLWAAYDGSAVDVKVGHYFPSGSNEKIEYRRRGLCYPDIRFGVDGTLKKFRFRGYTSIPDDDVNPAEIRFYSGSKNNLVLEKTIDISDQVSVYTTTQGYKDEVIIHLNEAVKADWTPAVYIEPHRLEWTQDNSGSGQLDAYTFFYNAHPTDNPIDSDQAWEWTVEVDNSFIFWDNKTGINPNHPDYTGGSLSVPLTVPQSGDYYIVFEGCRVPDGESLKINFDYFKDNGDNTTDLSYTIDYAGGTNDGFIYDSDDPLRWESIKGQQGDAINYYFYIGRESKKTDVYICNTNGQGFYGNQDKRFISLNDREAKDYSTAHPIQRIHFTNTGGNASIGRIVVCKKPIVAIGDSWTSYIVYSLDYGQGLSKKHYVVNAGIGGVGLTVENYERGRPMIDRWNSLGSYVKYDDNFYECLENHVAKTFVTDLADGKWRQTAELTSRAARETQTSGPSQPPAWAAGKAYIGSQQDDDLCAFRNIVYLFVNGLGLWDVGYNLYSGDEQKMRNRAYQVCGAMTTMASDAVNDIIGWQYISPRNNDLILMENRYTENGSEAAILFKKYIAKIINENLKQLSYRLQVPLARTGNFDLEWELGKGIHPAIPNDTDIIVAEIKRVYESNIIHGVGNCPTFIEGCDNPPQMDINCDCQVDIADFAVFAKEWMTSGFDT